MEDAKIVELYWQRSESAIAETAAKYGAYCRSIAFNILSSLPDSEEAVNDTYLSAWNSMPPHRPSVLSSFLGKITRRISIDRWRERHAARRGGGEVTLALDELSECIASRKNTEQEAEEAELGRYIDGFIMALPEIERHVFISRYWYLESVERIARRFGFTESKVKMMLHRSRVKLREFLEKEGLM
ncbi:MAG: sigma-70 family RNA polymerase sigma factor [Oscillospiraceae bacterium]|nr:sigma-70 family RNA polymerase sigma factor [Oscillospiraceae bacterium]